MKTASDSMDPREPTAGSALSNKPLVSASAVAAFLFCWVAISFGFFGLRVLIRERPQFVGYRAFSNPGDLEQSSPRLFLRHWSDDASVVRESQPGLTQIQVRLQGRRDYRGLRTVVDMTGEFEGRYSLANTNAEPMFVYFQFPLPDVSNRSNGSGYAGSLEIESSHSGEELSKDETWNWSGVIPASETLRIVVRYGFSSLAAFDYAVEKRLSDPLKRHEVRMTAEDLPFIRFQSGDGIPHENVASVEWTREEFLTADRFTARITEERNLYSSLTHLMEIGPLVAFLFLAAALSILATRGVLTPLQILTIGAGFAFYFPLVLYLSARFSFGVSLAIAVGAPGLLLLNYCRWLLGAVPGVLGGMAALGIYQIFPTWAAFAGWNRGMVLLCLGLATMFVLVHLQNRCLKSRSALAVVLAAGLWLNAVPSARAEGDAVQVILPARFAQPDSMRTSTTRYALGPSESDVELKEGYAEMRTQIPVRILKAVEDDPFPLFKTPVHLTSIQLPEFLAMTQQGEMIHLSALEAGAGTIEVECRIPFEREGNDMRCSIPLPASVSSNIRLKTARSDVRFVNGELWDVVREDDQYRYHAGSSGISQATVAWPADGNALSDDNGEPLSTGESYGVLIQKSRHLTMIHSNGECVQFSEYELKEQLPESISFALPAESRILSVELDGYELPSIQSDDRNVSIPLKAAPRNTRATEHRLTLHYALPEARLGFLGEATLELPAAGAASGKVRWLVALPPSFQMRLISSELAIRSLEEDFNYFGDYGLLAKSQTHLYLAKELVSPGRAHLRFRYEQSIPQLEGQEN